MVRQVENIFLPQGLTKTAVGLACLAYITKNTVAYIADIYFKNYNNHRVVANNVTNMGEEDANFIFLFSFPGILYPYGDPMER